MKQKQQCVCVESKDRMTGERCRPRALGHHQSTSGQQPDDDSGDDDGDDDGGDDAGDDRIEEGGCSDLNWEHVRAY